MKTVLSLPLLILFLIHYTTSNAQNCTFTCPQNIVVKADSGQEGTHVNFPSVITNGDCTINFSPASGSFFRLGSSSVIVTSSTGQRCSFTVTVTDNESPVLSPITLSLKRLWPANGRMRDVAVHYLVSDNGEDVNCTLSVNDNDSSSSNQNWEIIDNHTVRLKASRLSTGMPRMYTITVTCTDAAGNSTKRSTSISVAKTITPKK